MKGELTIQGDVDLIPVDESEIPTGSWETKEEITLALGEQSGHHHRLYAPPDGLLAELNLKGRRFVKISKPTELWHDKEKKVKAEHEMLIVPPGTYEIKIETEYCPFTEEMRKVVD